MGLTNLLFASCQAPIADGSTREITQYVAERLGITLQFVDDRDWQARELGLEGGEIDAAWICGAPYVEKMGRRLPLELLAAPVMADPRYQDRPIYFSEVIVRADSLCRTFDDLCGATWAYNEPHSHSGYHAVRYFLTAHGLKGSFFGRVVESGAHEISVRMIREGLVDSSAIDSTVLDLLYRAEPGLRNDLRVIEVIGPSPCPPYVVGTHVPPELRSAMRETLLSMDKDIKGRAVLERAMMRRFAAVRDADYDPIREMLKAARGVEL